MTEPMRPLAAREPDEIIGDADALVRHYHDYPNLDAEAGTFVDTIEELLDLIQNSADVIADMLAVIEHAGLTYP